MGWLNKLFNLESFKAASEAEPGYAQQTPSYGGSNISNIPSSGASASKRLKLVLMHDRTQLSPAMMEQMRDELVDVISRYVEIDKSALDINLESESNTIALVANIPVLRARSGIDDTLTKQNLKQPSEVLPNAQVRLGTDNNPIAPSSSPFQTSVSPAKNNPTASAPPAPQKNTTTVTPPTNTQPFASTSPETTPGNPRFS